MTEVTRQPSVSALAAAVELLMAADGEGRLTARERVIAASVHLLRHSDTDPAACELESALRDLLAGEWNGHGDPATTIAFLAQQVGDNDRGPSDRRDDEMPALTAMRARLLDLDALAALPPPEWLIGDVLVRSSLALLYGKPGASKSFVALDWALSVASGCWWFGHPVAKGDVLYVAAEGVRGLAPRVKAWRQARVIHRLDGIVWLPAAANLLDLSEAAALALLVEERRPTLVVIDTLARSIVGGDENSAKDMGVALAAADRVRQAGDACVLLVHHDTKEGGTPRGSSALLGAADTVIACESDGTRVTLRNRPPHGKAKDAEPFADIRLERVVVADSCALTDRLTTTAEIPDSGLEVLRALDAVATPEGVSTSVWRASSGVAERSFYRWQKRLGELGLTATVGEGQRKHYTLSEQGRELIGA